MILINLEDTHNDAWTVPHLEYCFQHKIWTDPLQLLDFWAGRKIFPCAPAWSSSLGFVAVKHSHSLEKIPNYSSGEQNRIFLCCGNAWSSSGRVAFFHHTVDCKSFPVARELADFTLTFLCLHCRHPFLDFLCCLLAIGATSAREGAIAIVGKWISRGGKVRLVRKSWSNFFEIDLRGIHSSHICS